MIFTLDGRSGFSVSTTNISSSVSLCSGLPLYYVICDASASVQSWFWSYNETSNLTRFYNLSSTRSILVLCNLTVSQTGTYTCTALSFDGEIARASTYITICKLIYGTAFLTKFFTLKSL